MSTLPLDPEPYVSNRDFSRWSHDWHGAPSIEFRPRPEYSQDQEDYRLGRERDRAARQYPWWEE